MSATLHHEHFIKPLFPGFEDELLIPSDFMEYLKGQKGEIAMLRSKREGKLWPVKINGMQFGDGWNQFVHDHDLQLGDCLLFRHEGNLVFYVLVFGHNTCERKYPPFVEIQEQNLPDCTSDPPFIAAKEEPLEFEDLDLPNSSNDHLPVAAIEEGPIEIQGHYLPRDSSTGCPLFSTTEEELIEVRVEYGNECPPFCATEDVPIEIQGQNLRNHPITGSKLGKYKIPKISLEAKANCVVRVPPMSIKNKTLNFPVKFTREIGLYGRTYPVTLLDENSDYWRAILVYCSYSKRFCIGSGWSAYHNVHKLRAGDLLKIELVKTGITPIFKISKIQEDSEFTREPSCQNNSDESGIWKKYKLFEKSSEAKACSSSVLKKIFFLVEVTYKDDKLSPLHIPRSFSKHHFKNKEYSEVILREQEGRSWPAKLGFNIRLEYFYIAYGWEQFAASNKLKWGDSLVFEFIENGERPIFNIYGSQSFSGKTWKDVLPHFFVNMQLSWCLRDGRHTIPKKFARRHGFASGKCSTLTITNELGKSWEVSVRLDPKSRVYMQSGFKDFVVENGIGEDDVFMLELVKRGDIPEMRYYALKQVKENNQEGILEGCEDVKPNIF